MLAGQYAWPCCLALRLGPVGIGAVEADLDAGAAYLDACGHAGHFMVEIGMVGMQHQHRAEQLDRREILVGVDRVGAKHQAQERLRQARLSVTSRLTPTPRGSERPKSSARIHGCLVRFITMSRSSYLVGPSFPLSLA